MDAPDTADQTWRAKAIGLLDLDAFFASVEQLDHPEWRGKPVIVGGSADKRGVVSTASYEARKFGVHSAMPSFQAQRLCPHAIWTHGHFDRYRAMSKKVMSLILDETPLVEQVSIDEAFFDVSPGRFSNEDPVQICKRIQSRVAGLGITCSIGLGTSKTVAKIASDKDKPRGLTVVRPGSEAAFLAPLPVRVLSGVGSSTEKVLQGLHIRTLGQLARQDPKTMQARLGVMGPRLVERAAGREQSVVRLATDHEQAKSVSNERTFARDLCTKEELVAAIGHVSELVGTRLRNKGLQGSLITLKLKFDYTHTHTAQRHLASPTNNERVFGKVAQDLLPSLWNEGTPVRLVGVAMSEFDTPPQQMSLFDQNPIEESDPLPQVTDQLRARFGKDAISYGRDLRL
ncbi:MAG: DNA polymerase IV [Coriobacteriales bacterium]|nr:DNA polymerase IV [Coriobacteriales bacterium]